MAKRKSSNFRSLPGMKKSAITMIIAILSYLFFQLTQPVVETTYLPDTQNPVQLYANQTHDDLTQLYVSAIQEAKSSITLIIYALTDRQVIQALNEKADQGISVYIVSDAKASPGLRQKIPKATVVRRLAQGLTHQKILIIDENHILLGSANLTTDSLKLHGNLVIGLTSPSLAQALTEKAKSMDEDGGFNPLTHREMQAGPQHLELWVLPDDPGAVKRMRDILQSATKSIKVAMYTWTRTDFTQDLIQAAKRGVKVEVIIDRYSGKGASDKVVKMLDKAGIPVHLSTGKGLLHHKFAYIDDSILVNGSANWTYSAFKDNDDCFIVLYPLTTDQQAKMNRLWQEVWSASKKPTYSNKGTEE